MTSDMNGTALTARQILMVVLCVVIFMGGMIGAALIMIPSNDDPQGSRNVGVVSLAIATLATIWFVS